MGIRRTKKRDLTFRKSSFSNHLGPGNAGVGTNSFVGKQETTSESTLWPWLQKMKREGKKPAFMYTGWFGSAFDTFKHDYEDTCVQTSLRTTYLGLPLVFNGPAYPFASSLAPSSVHWPTLSNTDENVLSAMGTTAIARVAPTNPVSGLANFVGELKRDGLPTVPISNPKEHPGLELNVKGNPGNEYLNWEFGWRPIISDARDFAGVVKNHDKIIKQLMRDSGRIIRRGYSFPRLQDTETVTVATGVYPINTHTQFFSQAGTLTRTRTTISDTWFSGAFQYYIPLGDDVVAKFGNWQAKANKLWGVKLTPELLWDLAPWSWAVDWFSNVGDNFHNISAFALDNLVLRYGFVMQRSTITDVYELSGYKLKSNVVGYLPPRLTQTLTTVRKVRRVASPYGFGLKPIDFSDRQWAILVALGISQGNHQWD